MRATDNGGQDLYLASRFRTHPAGRFPAGNSSNSSVDRTSGVAGSSVRGKYCRGLLYASSWDILPDCTHSPGAAWPRAPSTTETAPISNWRSLYQSTYPH